MQASGKAAMQESRMPRHGTRVGISALCILAFCMSASTGLLSGQEVIDRVMAADFDWSTGPAPRYVEAYRRAVAIRRATA